LARFFQAGKSTTPFLLNSFKNEGRDEGGKTTRRREKAIKFCINDEINDSQEKQH